MILFKLLNRSFIIDIHGCVSTGKKANVYHAFGEDEQELAIKIYKTSILVFKDRDKYVSGEFRFRHGYCRSNPRKMVQTWAEKELRNLIRMNKNGINSPKPILLKSHVLVMEFLGTDGWPLPKLKDADLSESKSTEIYWRCVVAIWKMYNQCKLVHADLSEYNMLYGNGELYIIDVSQSVEHDHHNALEFLRKDCTNVTDYFRKRRNVMTATVKELFSFITDPNISEFNLDHCLEQLRSVSSERTIEEFEALHLQDEYFNKIYIPRRLNEIGDHEKDFSKISRGEESKYSDRLNVIGLKDDLSAPREKPVVLEDCESDSRSESDDSSDARQEDEETKEFATSKQNKEKSARRPRDESANSKKERKNEVKNEKAEKRKTKMKKHLKKKKEKQRKPNSK